MTCEHANVVDGACHRETTCEVVSGRVLYRVCDEHAGIVSGILRDAELPCSIAPFVTNLVAA